VRQGFVGSQLGYFLQICAPLSGGGHRPWALTSEEKREEGDDVLSRLRFGWGEGKIKQALRRKEEPVVEDVEIVAGAAMTPRRKMGEDSRADFKAGRRGKQGKKKKKTKTGLPKGVNRGQQGLL